jgi:hypothetical protein
MTEERKLQSPDPAPKQPIAPDLKAPAGPAPSKDAAEAAKLADKVHANA